MPEEDITAIKVNLGIILRGDIDELKLILQEISKHDIQIPFKTISGNRLKIVEEGSKDDQ